MVRDFKALLLSSYEMQVRAIKENSHKNKYKFMKRIRTYIIETPFRSYFSKELGFALLDV